MLKNSGFIHKAGVPVIFIGGLILIAFLVWTPSAKHTDNINVNSSDKIAKIGLSVEESDYSNRSEPSNKIQLTGKLFENIPSYFEIAFAVNIKSIKNYFWSHSLLSLVKQPNISRKLDSLNISLNGINKIVIGLLPRTSTLKWINNRVIISLPPFTFLLVGRDGRMEALRYFWKNDKQNTKIFKQGDFQLGFPLPSKSYFFVGTYKTNLKPVIDLVEKSHTGYSICSGMKCRKLIASLGLVPDLIVVYKPKYSLYVKGILRLKSLLTAMELNPDGLILRNRIITNLKCGQSIPILKKFINHSLLNLKIENNILKKTNFKCDNNIIITTTLVTSSEVTNDFFQLGLSSFR